ncbi:MAG: hypothetical protein ACOX1F_03125 [Erysipelotrichaceae bacterium]|jgi:hypothetical protein
MKKDLRILLIFFFCIIAGYLLNNTESENVKNKKEQNSYDRPLKEVLVHENRKPQKQKTETQAVDTENKTIEKDGCMYVWVIDVPYQRAIEEKGHYEIIHHEAVTRVINIYQEFKTYYFIREDETFITVDDYQGFSAEEYFNSLPQEFYRYYYKITKKIIGQQTVVDREAYDEEIWVVDQPYQPAVEEKGHYEKTGC